MGAAAERAKRWGDTQGRRLPAWQRKRRKRSRAQRAHLHALHRMRRHDGFEAAFRYGPVIRWCKGKRMTQRQIVAYFNERRFPLPSQFHKRGRRPASQVWHLAQIQRLMQKVEELREK